MGVRIPGGPKWSADIEYEWRVVTPVMAAALLERNFKRNRSKSKRQITRYATQMKTGEWFSIDTIVITKDGFVINGQHRLEAVIESGVTIKLLFALNAPMLVVDGIDMNKSRNISDVAQISGRISDKSVMKVANRMLTGANHNRFLVVKTDNDHISYAEKYLNSIKFAKDLFRTNRTGISQMCCKAIVARAHASRRNRGKLIRFVDILYQNNAERGEHAVSKLVMYLLNSRSESRSHDKSHVYKTIEFALDCFLRGEDPKRLVCAEKELFQLPEDRELQVIRHEKSCSPRLVNQPTLFAGV